MPKHGMLHADGENRVHVHKFFSIGSIRKFIDKILRNFIEIRNVVPAACVRSSVTINRQRLTHAHAHQFYLSVAANSYCSQQCRLCSLTHAHGRAHKLCAGVRAGHTICAAIHAKRSNNATRPFELYSTQHTQHTAHNMS